MLEPFSATELVVVLPSALPSSTWARGDRRMLLLAAVPLLAVMVSPSRAIRSWRIRGDWGAVMLTLGAAIQAPATTRSL